MKVRLFSPSTGDIYHFETERLAAIYLSDLYDIQLEFVHNALKRQCRRYKEFTIRYQ